MSLPPKTERILVVDDSANTLEVLQRNLGAEGYQVLISSNVPEAIRVLDSNPIDLVITDLKMPKVSGLDLVRHIRENFKDIEVMMITGYPSVEGAVEAVKTGAEEYLANRLQTKNFCPLSAVFWTSCAFADPNKGLLPNSPRSLSALWVNRRHCAES